MLLANTQHIPSPSALVKHSEEQSGTDHQRALGQYFTPRWAAEAIVQAYFSDLDPGSTVIEPSCGDGRFLISLPAHLNAIGVEIDPQRAAQARALSGRRVITGDFLAVDLPSEAAAIIGNPPFNAAVVASFLDRAHTLLRDGGRCGFILPAYIHQTHSKVLGYAKDWSIRTELMPRNLFPGLSLPITFTVFTKDRRGRLVGFFLYREAAEVADATPETRRVLEASPVRGSVWRQIVNAAFDAVGKTEARLSDLYGAVTRNRDRPSQNRFSEQQVRKVLQTYPEFQPVQRGVWARVIRML